jgi:hypothetical protein
MDENVHNLLISDATKTLGMMHLRILKAAHVMDAKRRVKVKAQGNFGTEKLTDFGKQVGVDEINWWITQKEPDVDELLAHTVEALKAAQTLKKASEKLHNNEIESYEDLLRVLRGFADKEATAIKVLAEYVAWLEKRDEMATRILFTYRVWGSTRMGNRELEVEKIVDAVSEEELLTLAEIVLGVAIHKFRVYDRSHIEIGGEIYESMDPEQIAANQEIVVPEKRVVRLTAREVFENCATYFHEIRDSLRNIEINKFKAQNELLQSDAFLEEFIRKAAGAKTSEPQLWDFKETLNIWHVKGEPARRDAKVDFAENVASFANSTGGILIVGVTDKREIVGVGDGKTLENQLKVARDVLAKHIEYEREIATFRQVPVTENDAVKICLVIIISHAYEPVGAGDGEGHYTYPVRRETGITRVSRDEVPTNWHQKADKRDFLEDIRLFTKH